MEILTHFNGFEMMCSWQVVERGSLVAARFQHRVSLQTQLKWRDGGATDPADKLLPKNSGTKSSHVRKEEAQRGVVYTFGLTADAIFDIEPPQDTAERCYFKR